MGGWTGITAAIDPNPGYPRNWSSGNRRAAVWNETYMCGLAGVAGRGPRVTERAALDAISLLRHRGPDVVGSWSTGDASWAVALASSRLAILDLSPAGHMPMLDTDVRIAVAYNGEIYNH